MSIDPQGRFGPLGKYGAYGRVGSAINLVFSIGLFIAGTIMMITRGFPSGMPVWFAVAWWGIGAFIIWRCARVFRSVRRRERENAEDLRLAEMVAGETHTSSPNQRPGKPLRSWREETWEREHNARAVLKFSEATDAVRKLIAGESLTTEDIVSLGRLNSFCVAQWYEPLVELMREPFIDPDVADFFGPLVKTT
ncbi:hypothetical protein [Microbacterium sp. LWO12-1.2]|uniref:hypothetical protein n=1 Tax=Microbacterium sp. LWO12-1.2 TaxID=3135261 RepID=UPI0034236B53